VGGGGGRLAARDLDSRGGTQDKGLGHGQLAPALAALRVEGRSCSNRRLSQVRTLGMKLHFIPVEKPAPPLPRMPLFLTWSMIHSGPFAIRSAVLCQSPRLTAPARKGSCLHVKQGQAASARCPRTTLIRGRRGWLGACRDHVLVSTQKKPLKSPDRPVKGITFPRRCPTCHKGWCRFCRHRRAEKLVRWRRTPLITARPRSSPGPAPGGAVGWCDQRCGA
jgi:hypothetical protein